MSSFTDPLYVEILQGEFAGKGLATLSKEFHFYVDDAQTDVITVPVGYITDFASIPRILMSIFPVLGKAAKAAVVHDYLLTNTSRSQKECADIFLIAMTVLKVPPIRKRAMYIAVRYWPWISRKYRY
jgi:hypothetical protein